MSDTHGDASGLVAVLGRLGRSVQALVHLGDGAADVEAAMRSGCPMPPSYAVRGNVDPDWSIPPTRRIAVNDMVVLAAHGHHYPSDSLEPMVRAARSQGARGFLFGHTHVPFWRDADGILLLNPGSLSRPRGPWGASFAVLEAPAGSSGQLDAKLYELCGPKAAPRFRAIHHQGA